MNYLVTVSYDGTNFHGWAKQTGLRTVQETIEKILSNNLHQTINIFCSGRTDAYVHAINQTFSFKFDSNRIKPITIMKILTLNAPNDIVFKSIKVVDDKFHARYSALEKTYKYVINLKKIDVFKNNYQLNYLHKVNMTLIKKASRLFIGEHDFKSFSTSVLEDTVRKIISIKFSKHANTLVIYVTGNGFLRNMVRMIVGALLDVTERKKTLNDIKKLLANPQKGASITKVKGCGLYLYKVKY